ncbi:CPBP family intramembrane metalloprotease [Clostridium perfringens]|uniref:CPBP family intramembrane glutamic endopeptidase n=1 Tax=Clostridium perfringens TaxID=1502 RepID=UPI001ABAE118|nr:type II CAAX endopeptidase family protein [Clostridium perfringens]MBO3304336.1 CPBP family intramembrane metalloprotease [Clostridium perfringens]MBO3307656.1 CPBP family intramembrane metalloprotease [Clostridium perfringens]MBO3311026.1 CPBP family intramembrane metalloprotease [Clostridium perfringens]MBO3317290.1 CPBP family intramembrane metalloprotease [Clostridium perfringens]
MKRYKNSIFIFIYVLLILIYPKTPLLEIIFKNNESLTRASLYSFYLVHIFLFLVGVYLYKDIYIKGVLKIKEKPLKFIFFLIIGIVAIYMSDTFFDMFIKEQSSNQEALISTQKYITGLTSIFYYITTIIIGPLNEELIFRNILIGNLKKYIPTMITLIISSILFGLIHIHSSSELIQVLPYIGSGLIFGLIYWKSNCNLVYSSSLHILNNLLGILAIQFS